MQSTWPWTVNYTSSINPDGYFTGMLDDVALFNRALQDAEVYSLSASPLLFTTSGAIISDDANILSVVPSNMVLLLQFDRWLATVVGTIGQASFSISAANPGPIMYTAAGPLCYPASSAAPGQMASYVGGGANPQVNVQSCSAGYSSWSGSSVCSICPAGYISSAGSSCTACPAGSQSTSDGGVSSSCVFAPLGFVSVSAAVPAGGSSSSGGAALISVVLDSPFPGLSMPPAYPLYVWSGTSITLGVSAGPTTPQMDLVNFPLPGSSTYPSLPTPLLPSYGDVPSYPSSTGSQVSSQLDVSAFAGDPFGAAFFLADQQSAARLNQATAIALFLSSPLVAVGASNRRRLLMYSDSSDSSDSEVEGLQELFRNAADTLVDSFGNVHLSVSGEAVDALRRNINSLRRTAQDVEDLVQRLDNLSNRLDEVRRTFQEAQELLRTAEQLAQAAETIELIADGLTLTLMGVVSVEVLEEFIRTFHVPTRG